MSTMNISLPDALKSYVDEQVVVRRFGTSSEYVRDLIRRDQMATVARFAPRRRRLRTGGARRPVLF